MPYCRTDGLHRAADCAPRVLARIADSAAALAACSLTCHVKDLFPLSYTVGEGEVIFRSHGK